MYQQIKKEGENYVQDFLLWKNGNSQSKKKTTKNK